MPSKDVDNESYGGTSHQEGRIWDAKSDWSNVAISFSPAQDTYPDQLRWDTPFQAPNNSPEAGEPVGLHQFLRKWLYESIRRVQTEIRVFFKLDQRGWKLFFLLAYILYIVKNVFRQIAFSLYEPREPLWDLGFQLVPKLINNGLYNDLPAVILSFVTPFSLVLLPLFYAEPHKRGIYGCRIGYRILVQLCIGHTLRFMTYVSTSLPGARSHCQPGPEYLQPPRGIEIFRFTAGMAPNCGDLVFSGHMFQALTMVLAASSYIQAFLPGWPRLRRALLSFMILCCVIQVFTILASRSHYSVDIVVACYTSVLLWTVLWDRWPDPSARADAPELPAQSRGGEPAGHCDGTPMLRATAADAPLSDSDLSRGDTDAEHQV